MKKRYILKLNLPNTKTQPIDVTNWKTSTLERIARRYPNAEIITMTY